MFRSPYSHMLKEKENPLLWWLLHHMDMPLKDAFEMVWIKHAAVTAMPSKWSDGCLKSFKHIAPVLQKVKMPSVSMKIWFWWRHSQQVKWAASSEFVSSSIPSWQVLTAHAQPFRGARDLAFCLKVPLDSLLVWASSEGSGETARMRRLAWTFAARIGDKYQIRLMRSKWCS